jgi:predicted nucleic acid-binding protein
LAYLADANVLIALLHARHVLSGRVVAWLDNQREPRTVLVCRVAQMAVLRVLTNPAWLKEEVLRAAAVWEAWDLLLTDNRFAWVREPARLEEEWRFLTRSFPAGRCADTDSYFAAFARAGGFRRFPPAHLRSRVPAVRGTRGGVSCLTLVDASCGMRRRHGCGQA